MGAAVDDFFGRHPVVVEQPFDFPHDIHTGTQIACTEYCHESVSEGPVAGLPSVRTCMSCHRTVATDRPRIQQLTQMQAQGRDFAWRRVFDYPAPSHVRFNHAPHIRGKVECSTCHGNIGDQTVAQRNVDDDDGLLRELSQRAEGVHRLPHLSLLMDRRSFIKLTAVTGTSAALASCGNPENQLIRFVPDEDIVPGIATWKPGVCPLCPSGCGLTVRVMNADADVVRNGQAGLVRIYAAKKLEGSPAHPVNHGGLCARGQAAIQVTYHPDRITQPLKRTGERGQSQYAAVSWDDALAELVSRLDALSSGGNQRALACLTRARTGHRAALIERFLSGFGAPGPIGYELFSDDVLRRANALSFGREQLPTFDLPNTRYRPELRRRLPRHVEFAHVAETRLRADAAGPSRRARHLRAGRVPHVPDRRQRRPVGTGEAGHRRRAGPRAGSRHHRGQASSRRRGWTARIAHRRVVLRLERLRAGAGGAGHRCPGDPHRAAGARVRRNQRRRSRWSPVLRSLTPTRSSAPWPSTRSTRSWAASSNPAACRSRRSLVSPPQPRPWAADPRPRRRSSGWRPEFSSGESVPQVLLLDGANPVFTAPPAWQVREALDEGALHRQLRQLPGRDDRPGGSDPARPLVPRVLDRGGARIRLDGGGGERGAAGHDAAARRRAPRPTSCSTSGGACARPLNLPWQTFEELLAATFAALPSTSDFDAWTDAQEKGGWWGTLPAASDGSCQCPGRQQHRWRLSSRNSTATRRSIRSTSCRTRPTRFSTGRWRTCRGCRRCPIR